MPIKKEHDNSKTTMYKIKFLIALDFCQPHYQILLITYLKLIKRMQRLYGKKIIKSECDLIWLKNNGLNYICKECGKKYSKLINEVIKKFPYTNQFCSGDLNKFDLLLRKGVYPYEYMDSLERFNETSLLDKKSFLKRIEFRRYY